MSPILIPVKELIMDKLTSTVELTTENAPIVKGYYLTRNGQEAKVVAFNASAHIDCQAIGWLNGDVCSWTLCGKYLPSGFENDDDLVEFVGPLDE
jgi:hypothetical protein